VDIAYSNGSSEAFTAVMFQAEVVWVVTLCGVVVGYQQHGLLKRLCPATTLHDVITKDLSLILHCSILTFTWSG